jgi:two-component system, cell cycle response regulator DivK
MTHPLALIIEDDPKLAVIFAKALEAAEFEPEVIGDGRAALTRLAEIIPSLVVLDLHLPHVSGVDILRQIRADTRFANTRVMIATADPLVAESLRFEADMVLLKPISFHQLRNLASRFQSPNSTS